LEIGNWEFATPVLFHSFTGSIETAQKVLESGYYISFNVILTYPNADDIREIFKFAWKNYPEQILSETDAPLLAPQGKRGEICYPTDVSHVVTRMTEIAGEETEQRIFQNAVRFYGIKN